MAVAEPISATSGDWEMIHELATDLFFDVESAETVAANFSFEDMTLAPTVDIPTPEPEAPLSCLCNWGNWQVEIWNSFKEGIQI